MNARRRKDRTGPSPWSRWKGLLALSVATSIGLNVWHAFETAAIGAAVLASIAPVFLFWITHNLVTDPGGVKSWREDKVGVAVATLVTLGAFTVSYVTQRDLAVLLGMELLVATILPLIVDLTIAVASYKLVQEAETAAEQVPRGAPAVVHQAVATTPIAPATTTPTTASIVATTPTATVSELPTEAATTTPAVAPADLVVDGDAITEELAVTCTDEVVVATNHPATTTAVAGNQELVDAAAVADNHPATTTSTAAVELPAQLPVVDDTTTDHPAVSAGNHPATTTALAGHQEPVDGAVDEAPVVDVPHSVVAELVAAGRVKPEKKAPAVAAATLLAADPRPSQRAVADATGLDRSTVKKLVDAMTTT